MVPRRYSLRLHTNSFKSDWN